MREALLARVAATQVGKLASELGAMLPLPGAPFDARRTLSLGVSQRSLVTVEGTTYSVPCRWAGLQVAAHVGPDAVDFVGPTGTVSRARGRFGERVIDYRDYLDELARKPQATRQVAAQLVADLGEPFASAWRLLVDAHGPMQAARIFSKVLAHIETRGARDVGERVAWALANDQHVLLALAPPAPPAHELPAEHVPAHLRHVHVEMASAADYDALVGGDA